MQNYNNLKEIYEAIEMASFDKEVAKDIIRSLKKIMSKREKEIWDSQSGECDDNNYSGVMSSHFNFSKEN